MVTGIRPAMTRRPQQLLLLLLLPLLPLLPRLTAALSSAGDVGEPTNCLTQKPASLVRRMFWRGEPLDLRLQVSDRPGSQLVAWIFKLFLREIYGYSDTWLVNIPHRHNMLAHLQYLSDCPGCSTNATCEPDRFSAPCRVPNVTINPAAWTPASYHMDLETEARGVMDIGRLGPSVRVGWFLQEALTGREHGIVDHWRAFQRIDIARVFNYTASERQALEPHLRDGGGRFHCEHDLCRAGVYTPARCRDTHCAVLLASTSDEANYVLELIEKLRLLVQVYWVGVNLDRLVTTRTQANRPVVFAHYTPSLLTLDAEYVEVAMPTCSQGAVCPTGTNHLQKLAWNQLRDGATMAHKALVDFRLTQRQYTDVLRLQASRPELGHDQVACLWMRQNATLYRSQWLNPGLPTNKIFIGGIFPFSGSHYRDVGVIPAVLMAIKAINANSSVLQGYDLTLMSSDGKCSSDMVIRAYINYLRTPNFAQMAGILGPACSDTVEPIAGVSRHFKVLIISYSAEGVLLSNRSQYPYFFRTIGENKQFRFVYKQVLAHLQWKRVASLTEAGQKYSEYISLLHDMLQESGVTFVSNRKFPSDTRNMEPYLKDLKDKNARIIIADMYQVAARAIMCEAYLQNMTARQGYIWFLPGWFPRGWYNDTSDTSTKCTAHQIMKALDGHLALAHAYFPRNQSDLMQEGISVREWRKHYANNCSKLFNASTSDYGSYAYDATWVYAYALDKLLRDEPSRYLDFHADDTPDRLARLVSATDFHGVSGHLRFVGPSRVSITEVKQWRRGQYYVVGSFLPDPGSPAGGSLVLNESRIQWLTEDGLRPVDGSSQPCSLQGLADLLGTDCQTAMIVVNLVGLLIFVVLVVACVLLYKRRYERKMLQLHEGLGLTGFTEWEIKRDNIVINRRLGKGAFGTVYGGEALLVRDRSTRANDRRRPAANDQPEEWCSVAVKTLKLNFTPEEKLDFLREAAVMKQLNHANIVQLLGVCTLSEPIQTVMEFMLYGDLKTFLLSRRSLVSEKSFRDEYHEISDKKLTSMARDVACALSYLADRKFVHRDVACRNCLVNAMHVVKLADFGMTRSLCENDYYKLHREGMLPVRWMAPESLSDGVFTPKSDMWSYGVLLFEITTFGSFPFQGMNNSQVLEHVRSGHHLPIPQGVKTELADLLLACWSVDPEQRPAAPALVELLGLQYPRLISPCLDEPLSVVQLDGPEAAAHLPAARRCSLSVPPRPRPARAAPHEPAAEPAEARQLLGAGSPSVGSPNGFAGKYVTLDHRPSVPCAETATM